MEGAAGGIRPPRFLLHLITNKEVFGRKDMDVRESTPGANDVERRAQAALAASPIYVLRELRVERLKDQLILTGHVDSYYHKQLAQEVIRAVAAGLRVVNEVVVLDNGWWDEPGPKTPNDSRSVVQGSTATRNVLERPAPPQTECQFQCKLEPTVEQRISSSR
jgi:hypothetical protein